MRCVHRARARAQTGVEFPDSHLQRTENITVIPKQGIKLEMDEVAENCAHLAYCAASSGNLLPTIPDSLSVPSSATKRGPIGCLETSARNYPYSA